MKRLLLSFILAVGVLTVAAVLFAGSGLYNVAADDEHTALVHKLLETTRERSVAARASDIEVSDLTDPEKIRRGAGNYDSMCVSCHLAPGANETELSRGLYPKPPNLTKVSGLDPARAFWIIKHGIKATGMPAWGRSMEDEYIWDMVAFIRQLREMSAEDYASAVRASEGHSHGKSQTKDQQEHAESTSRVESGRHAHDPGEEHSH